MLGHNRRMTGAECLADMLKGYGVTHVFHVPAVLRKTFAVMETRTDIKRLHVHGEKAAAYMADGYARASGKPGINQPWHWITIPMMGMTMGEIFYLKELAEDCAADKVYEFMFVAPAIPITGAVGSPTNPLAIK